MNILAIDTSTKTAGVAIKKDNQIFEYYIDNEITHSEKLLPLIANSLEKQNLTLDNINLLGIINGPGSFTGLRIGVATLKAFAQVKNLNIFSFSSTAAIAYSAYKKTNCRLKYFVSLIDARNDRVFFDIKKIESTVDDKLNITNLYNTNNLHIDDAIKEISNYFNLNNISISDVCVAGKGADKFKNTLLNSHFLKENLFELYPTPGDIIDLYFKINNKENFTFNAFTLDANYERKSQAERMNDNEK